MYSEMPKNPFRKKNELFSLNFGMGNLNASALPLFAGGECLLQIHELVNPKI